MPSVIEKLEDEWKRLAVDRRAARRLYAACAAAGGASNLSELERYVREAPAADADQVLVALVGPASGGGQLEARVLLHLLLPGVRRLARRWWALGDRDERAVLPRGRVRPPRVFAEDVVREHVGVGGEGATSGRRPVDLAVVVGSERGDHIGI